MATLIQPFDTVDGDPNRYIEYLRDCWRAAARTLRQPAQNWPTGNSHAVSREIQNLAQEYAFDMALEYGVYDAYGKLIGYERT